MDAVTRDNPAVLPAGASIAGDYTVVDLVHRSNFLDVYDVWSAARACHCVAKVMRPDRREDRSLRRDLLREGRLLMRLTHPHVIRVYEVHERPEPAVIFEPLTGPTLAAMLADRRRRLPLADILHLGLHLCAALHYLHGHNTLHLDLKPANIIAEGRTAKVLDLSQARPPGQGPGKWGTHEYMAPEQVCGGLFSPATDIWGLGAVLFEAATGRVAFPTDADASYYAQLDGPAPSVRIVRRVPPTFAALVARCLRHDTADRPTIPEVMGTLQALL